MMPRLVPVTASSRVLTLSSVGRAMFAYASKSLTRWIVVGAAFEAVGLPLLYVLHGVWDLPLFAATVLVAEMTALPRFFINDRWVFHHHDGTLSRLWRYHLACAGSFVTWLSVTNGLALLGVNYLIASVCGTGCSVGLAIASNFGWIWRPAK